MMNRTWIVITVAALLSVACIATVSAETVLYSENFNSGTSGQSITASPFNWTPVSGDIRIGNVGHTGWDGLHISAYDTWLSRTTADNRAKKTTSSVPTSGVLRLSFDAWTLTYGASQGEIALLDPASGVWPLKWVVGSGGWTLYHGYNLGSNWFYAGVDKGFHIDTYIDLDNSQFWGTITDDTGAHSSPVMSFSPGHTAYNALQIQCYTSSVWDRLDVDNIVLAVTPVGDIVSFMDADTAPTTTSGPQTRNYFGTVAFDYNYRTMFINADTGQSITTLTMKADPTLVAPGTVCNADLSTTTVELYYSSDNISFLSKNYTASKPDNNTYVLTFDAIDTSIYKYIKIHCNLGNTDYKFVNYVHRMIPTIVQPEPTYYQVTSPLFDPLLGTEPGPGKAFYWGNNVDNEGGTSLAWNRESATKFGFKYDSEFEYGLTSYYKLMPQGKKTLDFAAHGIDTYRQIMGDPNEAYAACFNGMPAVFGTDGWTMDTRWLDEYYNRAVARAAANRTTVGIYGAEAGEDNIKNYLVDTGMFNADDIYLSDIRTYTPSVDDLRQYDAVLIYSYYPFYDRVALGDNLADYVDAGGRVVVATFGSTCLPSNYPLSIQGRFATDAYMPWSCGSFSGANPTLGTYNANHPIMAGVSALSTYYSDEAVVLYPGATLVASWNSGSPVVATNHGDQVVGLGFYPNGGLPYITTGDYARLIANALTYNNKHADQWALWAGDEAWELYWTKAVPVASRYDYVLQADAEIKQDYGFGTYGMPDGDSDSDPAYQFRRIAHRRWVNDKLTAHFQRVYNGVKTANPNMILQSPDFASCVPAGDIEAWAPYFDIFTTQCVNWDWVLPLEVGVGCDTKIVSDLTGKPVWPAVQNAMHPCQPYQVSPENLREAYSQVFRNGGTGLMVLAIEWWDRELLHYGYSDPAAWNAVLQTIDVADNMNQVVLPTADCAILYPSDTLLTLNYGQYNADGRMELRSAYTMLGPLCGSWFKFISDRQIDRGTVNLSDYKVLYIPLAEYLRTSVVNAIDTYVQNGGTIVVTDIDAFSWNIDGTALTSTWETISGVRRGTARNSNLGVTTVANAWWTNPNTSWTMRNPCYNMTILDTPNVSKLAEFTSDNTPAMTIHHRGLGHVICYASDPFGLKDYQAPFFTAKASTLLPVFRAYQNAVTATMNRDIWRFKLPELTPWQEPAGYCLTGNYVPDRNTLNSPKNIATGGSYTYSRIPTGNSDVGSGATPILFAAGNLTDRITGYLNRYIGTGMQRSGSTQDYYVSWNDVPAVTVTVDLNGLYSLSKLNFLYSGILPNVTVSGSVNGIDWTTLGSLAAQPDTGGDVLKAEVSLTGTYCYLRLIFDSGYLLTLSELEIWGGA